MRAGDETVALITAALDSEDTLKSESIYATCESMAGGPLGVAELVGTLAGTAAIFLRMYAEGLGVDPKEFVEMWALGVATHEV